MLFVIRLKIGNSIDDTDLNVCADIGAVPEIDVLKYAVAKKTQKQPFVK